MKKYNIYFLSIAVVITTLFFAACNPDGDDILFENYNDTKLRNLLKFKSPTGSLDYYLLPSSEDYANIPQDPLNPITKEKVELGQILYHETGLGVASRLSEGKSTFSCASCHHAQADFQAGIVQGIGEGGVGFGVAGETRVVDPLYPSDSIDVQPIRTPTTLNSAFQLNMLWNGQFGATGLNVGTENEWKEGTPIATNHLGYEGLEIQAIAGLGVHRLDLDKALLEHLECKDQFDVVFSDFPEEERYTRETAGLAIAAYERTLLSNQAPFQRWLRGEELLSDSELQGAFVFFDKAKCDNCHTGPALNQMDFHAIGMHDLSIHDDVILSGFNDNVAKGRGGFTKKEEDNYKFKVPQLYNLKDIKFLGHGGSFHSVEEVVKYKNRAIPENPNVESRHLSHEFVPLGLTDLEIKNLVTFINEALYDSNLDRFVPSDIPSGNCFPNADEISRHNLNCN